MLDKYWAQLAGVQNEFLGDICNKLEDPSVENCTLTGDITIKEKGVLFGVIRLVVKESTYSMNFQYVLEKPQ